MGWRFNLAGMCFLTALLIPLVGVNFLYAFPAIIAGWVLMLWREA